jgi:hypothetical protein
MGRSLGVAAVLVLALAPGARAVDPAVARIGASAERASRQPADDKALRARVDSYLASIDSPISEDRWRALGPGAAAVLVEIAQDHQRLPTRRARAVSALGVVGATDAREMMAGLARNEDEHPLVRTAAVRTVATMLEGAPLLETLRPMLETARNAKVRVATAEALINRDRALGCPPVQKQVARETRGQRPAFTRALAGCH